jgi:hypothetical protein
VTGLDRLAGDLWTVLADSTCVTAMSRGGLPLEYVDLRLQAPALPSYYQHLAPELDSDPQASGGPTSASPPDPTLPAVIVGPAPDPRSYTSTGDGRGHLPGMLAVGVLCHVLGRLRLVMRFDLAASITSCLRHNMQSVRAIDARLLPPQVFRPLTQTTSEF